MYNKKNRFYSIVVLMLVLLSGLLTDAAYSQEEKDSSDNQPSYIDELVKNSQLTQKQVDNMRKNGQSWGNIKINTRIAQQIASKNTDPDKTYEQKYQEALNHVLQQRSAGRGYGNIANENNMKLGSVMGDGNGTQNQNREQIQQRKQTQLQTQNQERTQKGNKNQVKQKTQVKAKKKGFFGRFFGIFGIGKKKQKQNSSAEVITQKSSNKGQSQQNVSNKTQTQNSSSSQKIRTKERNYEKVKE
jgi:hypothetical protein